jgi:hypothetical protein
MCKEFQQCHMTEVVAHTSLLNVVDEVYVSCFDLPTLRKLIKVQEDVQQLQSHNV